MRYEAYRKQTAKAATAIGGEVASLAGGFYGATFPADSCHLVVCLDYDSGDVAAPWVAWRESDDGERCCDRNVCELGVYRPGDYAAMRDAALRAVVAHTCG